MIFTAYRQTTNEEGQIIYDFIKELRPKQILEIGTFAGFNTIWIASSIKDHNLDTKFNSVDYKRDLNPDGVDMLVQNNLQAYADISYVKDEEALLNYVAIKASKSDFIFVDECHDRIFKLWNVLKNNITDTIIMFHDVLSPICEAMQTPILFNQLKNECLSNRDWKIIVTKDDDGNNNGFGYIRFKEQKIETINNKQTTEDIKQNEMTKIIVQPVEEIKIEEQDTNKPELKLGETIVAKEKSEIAAPVEKMQEVLSQINQQPSTRRRRRKKEEIENKIVNE